MCHDHSYAHVPWKITWCIITDNNLACGLWQDKEGHRVTWVNTDKANAGFSDQMTYLLAKLVWKTICQARSIRF